MRSASPVGVVAWTAIALAATACRERPREPADVQTRQSALDFATGSVQGTILWNGAPATAIQIFGLTVTSPSWSTGVNSAAHYALSDVVPGDYQVTLGNRTPCAAPALATRSITVVAGATTTLDFDISDVVGRVGGRVTSNGAPVPNARVIFSQAEPDGGSSCPISYFSTDATGQFWALLTPGSYAGSINSGGSELAPFSFQIVAGATSDIGVLDVPTGSVQGTVTWNGAPATGLSSLGSAVVSSTSWSANVDGAGHYALANVLPGDYQLALSIRTACDESPLASQAATISAGTATTLDFDVSGAVGRIVGRITTNGVALANARVTFARQTDAGTCGSPSVITDAAGQFSTFLVPGSYSAIVQPNNLGNVLGSFNFQIVAGVTSDVGVRDIPAGGVQGSILWNGAPVNGLLSPFGIIVTAHSWLAPLDVNGRYAAPSVPPGVYDVSLINRGPCVGPPLATGTVTVTAGAITTLNLETATAVGRVVGRITTNGPPRTGARIGFARGQQPDAGPSCVLTGGTDGAGRFFALLEPGSYLATVNLVGSILGTFSFGVLVGQTTDIDTGASTPVGSDVAIDVLGGIASIGGLSMSFSSVTAAGETTVVESPVGPAPPPDYQIIGFDGKPRYWEIETTATYAGAITVCIHYDQSWIAGNETLLQLHHDAGDGFRVTDNMFLDVLENVVCGQVTSLSPFAIVEPIPSSDVTGPDFAAVPDRIVAYATSTQGAVVDYPPPTAVDAVDGTSAVTCTPAPGAQFPVGERNVTCTASDTHGNSSTASFKIWVQYQAPTDGSFFLKPVRADSSSIFRIGRPIPVRFQLTGASKNITDLRAHLIVTKVSDAIKGTVDDEGDEDGDETDFLFKYKPAKQLYVYRWKTRSETRGTYQLRADLGDGVVHQVNVSLKPAR